MKKTISGKKYGKSTLTPLEKIGGLFMDLQPEFCAGNFSSEFADVAIKLGDILLDEAKHEDISASEPYKHYLIAKYALELRMKHAYKKDDEALMNQLLPKLEEAKAMFIKEEETKNRVKEELGVSDESAVLEAMKILERFPSDVSPLVKIDKLENRKYLITLSCEPDLDSDNECIEKSLVTVPELGYCRLLEKIELISDYAPEILAPEKNNFIIYRLDIEDGKLIFLSYLGQEAGKSDKVLMRVPLEGLGVLKIK